MTRRRFALIALLVLAATNTLASPVASKEAEGFTITNAKLHQKKDFPAIVGNNPAFETPATVGTLSTCKSLPMSVAVKIGWKISSTRTTKATFTVTWKPAANDIDVYLFDQAGALIADSATGDPKETMNLAALSNGTYWVCVNSYAGPNAGFTVDVAVEFLPGYEPPPPPPTPVVHRTPKPSPKPTPTAEQTAPPAPTASPEAIATPGSDGPTKARDLVAVAGRRQATPSENGRSGLAIGLLALTGLIAVSGAGLVVLRIRRDTTA